MLRTLTPQTIAAALGGLATGYVLWLLAISNGDNATVGQWGPLVLVAMVVWAVAVAAALTWGT